MKVLYITTPSYADTDFPLIRAYQQKKIDVTVLILLPPFLLKTTLFDINEQIPRTGIFWATEYTELKVYESFMDMSKVFVANRTGKNSLTWSYWKHKLDLYRFITNRQFDIVHCVYPLDSRMNFLFRKAKKWIQTMHDPFPHSGEGSRKVTKAYKNTISRADYFVLLNENQKNDFCRYYSVNPERVIVSRVGICVNFKDFVKPNKEIKENNILFFGRISPYKGVEYLCEAMKIVQARIPNATLTIAGSGKMYFDIAPYKELGYIDVINRYIGMEELVGMISRCELTVCPYTDATQSGVIMTSYSLSKPVIATRVGGLPEEIEEGKTGLLIPPKNIEALAEAIISLLLDKEELKSMSEYINLEYGLGKKSWNRIAEKYIKVYERIVK